MKAIARARVPASAEVGGILKYWSSDIIFEDFGISCKSEGLIVAQNGYLEGKEGSAQYLLLVLSVHDSNYALSLRPQNGEVVSVRIKI